MPELSIWAQGRGLLGHFFGRRNYGPFPETRPRGRPRDFWRAPSNKRRFRECGVRSRPVRASRVLLTAVDQSRESTSAAAVGSSNPDAIWLVGPAKWKRRPRRGWVQILGAGQILDEIEVAASIRMPESLLLTPRPANPLLVAESWGCSVGRRVSIPCGSAAKACRSGQRADAERLAVRPACRSLGAVDQHGHLAGAKRLAGGGRVELLHAGRPDAFQAQIFSVRLDKRRRADPRFQQIGIEQKRVLIAMLAQARRSYRQVDRVADIFGVGANRRHNSVIRFAVPIPSLFPEKIGQSIELSQVSRGLELQACRPLAAAVRFGSLSNASRR